NCQRTGVSSQPCGARLYERRELCARTRKRLSLHVARVASETWSGPVSRIRAALKENSRPVGSAWLILGALSGGTLNPTSPDNCRFNSYQALSIRKAARPPLSA